MGLRATLGRARAGCRARRAARPQPFLRAMLPTSRRAAGLVHAATSLVFFARHLAPDGALTELCPDERAAVAEAGARLTAAAEAMAQALEEGLTVPAMPPATPLAGLRARREPTRAGGVASGESAALRSAR